MLLTKWSQAPHGYPAVCTTQTANILTLTFYAREKEKGWWVAPRLEINDTWNLQHSTKTVMLAHSYSKHSSSCLAFVLLLCSFLFGAGESSPIGCRVFTSLNPTMCTRQRLAVTLYKVWSHCNAKIKKLLQENSPDQCLWPPYTKRPRSTTPSKL